MSMDRRIATWTACGRKRMPSWVSTSETRSNSRPRPKCEARSNSNSNTRTAPSRPKTVSISLRDRGQTTQDFVVGIGVFLLAIAFVFSYVPTLLTPYSSSVSGGETAQADRIAATVLENVTDAESPPNQINVSAFEETYVGPNSSELATALGLRATNDVAIDRVNVSIERLNQSIDREDRRIISGGDHYGGDSAASSARIVTVDPDTLDGDSDIDLDECEPACRLVIRVW